MYQLICLYSNVFYLIYCKTCSISLVKKTVLKRWYKLVNIDNSSSFQALSQYISGKYHRRDYKLLLHTSVYRLKLKYIGFILNYLL